MRSLNNLLNEWSLRSVSSMCSLSTPGALAGPYIHQVKVLENSIIKLNNERLKWPYQGPYAS